MWGFLSLYQRKCSKLDRCVLKVWIQMTHSTTCCSCNNVNQSESKQIYINMLFPADDSSLNDYVEVYFNIRSLEGLKWTDVCQKPVQLEKRSQMTNSDETDFSIIILTRAVQTPNGFKLIKNKTNILIQYIKLWID